MEEKIYLLKEIGTKDFNEKCQDIFNIYLKDKYNLLELSLEDSTKFIQENNNKNTTIIIYSQQFSSYKFQLLGFVRDLKNTLLSKIIYCTYDFWKRNVKKPEYKMRNYYSTNIFKPTNYYVLSFANYKKIEEFRNFNLTNYKNRIFNINLWCVYKKAECEFNNNPINKILLTGRVSGPYPERNIISKYKNVYNYKYNDNDIKNNNNFNKILNGYLCSFTSSVYVKNHTLNKIVNTHIILLKVFEILGSGSLLLYPKSEEQYIKKIGLFHKDNCWLLDFDGNIQEQIDYILDSKNRDEIDKIRYRGWRHGIEKLNSYNKFLEFDNIVRNINRKYKLFSLDVINTLNKPGLLVNININKLNNDLKIDFHPTTSFYLTDLDSEKSRGNHANCNINEIIICLQGEFEIKLFDGKKEEIFKISKNNGIYVPKNIWLDFYNFKNCVLLVYTDLEENEKKKSIYNKNEFIKNYI